MFAKIVVGVDGSEPSEHALRLACDLAQKYESKLHVINTPKAETVAFALGATMGYHAVTTMPDRETVEKAAEKVLASAQTVMDEYGLKAEHHIGKGTDPAGDVVSCAEEFDADLIVTGRRGLGQIAGALMGSTSQNVSKSASCAHLTVA